MRKFFTAAAIATTLLVSGNAMAEDTTAADAIRDARTAARLAFETPASKAALNKIAKSYNVKVPGRDCDYSHASLDCSMEDGTSVSVEAVPVNTSEAKAAELCTNPYDEGPDYVVSVGPKKYANGVDKTKVELKGNPKQKFLMLWCTTEARDWSVAAAEKRKEWAKAPATPIVTADFEISNGKLIPFFGSVRQAISVKNNTGTAERQTFIECGFFLKGELVGTGLTSVGNLMPGATKHTTVLGLDVVKADKVECNVKN